MAPSFARQLELTPGRDLFPGSDCLRFSDRKPMLQSEMEAMADADVICLQVSRSPPLTLSSHRRLSAETGSFAFRTSS